MPSTAGNLLLRAGLITSGELAQASSASTKAGTLLGEELIRAGVIHELTLVDFFHHRLMIQRLPADRLEKVSSKVVATVPADMAVEFRVVPVEIDGDGALILAMADPTDTHAVDEVKFFTERFVVRTVASAGEIRRALTKYYGAKLVDLPTAPVENLYGDLPLDNARFGARERPVVSPAAAAPFATKHTPTSAAVTVTTKAKPLPKTTNQSLPVFADAPAARRPRPIDDDRTPLPEPYPLSDAVAAPELTTEPASHDDAYADEGNAPVLLTRVKSRAGEIVTKTNAPDLADAPPRSTDLMPGLDAQLAASLNNGGARLGDDQDGEDADMEIETAPAGPATDRMVAIDPHGRPLPEPDSDEPILLTRPIRAAERKRTTLTGAGGDAPTVPLGPIRAATSRDEVASQMLDYVVQLCRRALLMVIRRGQLVGFAARGDDAPRLAQLSLPLDAPTLLRDVIVSRLPYRGPLPITEENDRFADALGGVGAEVLVMPITIREKLIALLYADSPIRPLPDAELHAVTREVGLAFERLILEKHQP